VVRYEESTEAPRDVITYGSPDLGDRSDLELVAPAGPAEGFQSIGRSALSHPALVGFLLVIGLAAGAVAGYEHPVTYTAQAKLIVGRTSGLAEDEVPGLAAAVQGLASDYARLITATNVVSATEAKLHTSTLPGTLSASPIPQSSVINVQASASSEAVAISLANAGAAALTKAVTQITNDSQAQLLPILKDYNKADTTVEQETATANLLQTELNNFVAKLGNQTPTPADQVFEQSLNSQIAQAQTQADTARMQANAYMNQYQAALPPLQSQQEMVQQVGQAAYNGSNRNSYTEAAGLGGAVAGLVIGLAGASFIDSRRGRRRATAFAN
jgi:hypothetical protein